MPKAVTEKDVLYALEYGGERLVRSAKGWRLSSGAAVPKSVADHARARLSLTLVRRDGNGEHFAMVGEAA